MPSLGAYSVFKQFPIMARAPRFPFPCAIVICALLRLSDPKINRPPMRWLKKNIPAAWREKNPLRLGLRWKGNRGTISHVFFLLS